MLGLILYLLMIFILLIFLILISIYTLFLIYSSVMGSPFVPTKKRELGFILKEAKLKPNSYFVELGCGDGRVVATAVKNYHVQGLGVDINPLIVFYAKLLTKIKRIKNIEFRVQNILETNLNKADYIYLFLMPDLLRKLTLKLERELKKNTVIISHGFKIEGWEKKLFKIISHIPFPTYFYKV